MRLSWKRTLFLGIVLCIFVVTGGQVYNFWNLRELTQLYRPQTTHKYARGTYQPAPPWVSDAFEFPTNSKDAEDWNRRELIDLRACVALDNCGVNQKKVALLATATFEMGVISGNTGGESVWARSMYLALKDLGYTVFFSWKMEDTIARYRSMPELVRIVVFDNTGRCHLDKNCVKSESNPTGIPAWKTFELAYWPVRYHRGSEWSMMGGEWVITSHPDDEHLGETSPLQYIGFSVEDSCPTPLPIEERERKIYMHMKYQRYLFDDKWSWNISWFPEVAEELNATFVGGWVNDNGSPAVQEDKIVNLGRLNHDRFVKQLASSRVFLTMGNPFWSPSPWLALCMGVPVVQPIMRWDENDPWNKKKWELQHPSLQRYRPPYVYHVHARNHNEFMAAIKAAFETPIERVVPSFMTTEAVRRRVEKLMETDWRYRAAELLVQRVKAANGSYEFAL